MRSFPGQEAVLVHAVVCVIGHSRGRTEVISGLLSSSGQVSSSVFGKGSRLDVLIT